MRDAERLMHLFVDGLRILTIKKFISNENILVRFQLTFAPFNRHALYYLYMIIKKETCDNYLHIDEILKFNLF